MLERLTRFRPHLLSQSADGGNEVIVARGFLVERGELLAVGGHEPGREDVPPAERHNVAVEYGLESFAARERPGQLEVDARIRWTLHQPRRVDRREAGKNAEQG